MRTREGWLIWSNRTGSIGPAGQRRYRPEPHPSLYRSNFIGRPRRDKPHPSLSRFRLASATSSFPSRVRDAAAAACHRPGQNRPHQQPLHPEEVAPWSHARNPHRRFAVPPPSATPRLTLALGFDSVAVRGGGGAVDEGSRGVLRELRDLLAAAAGPRGGGSPVVEGFLVSVSSPILLLHARCSTKCLLHIFFCRIGSHLCYWSLHALILAAQSCFVARTASCRAGEAHNLISMVL
jgi:hypothetical protein